jgi:hypothetical protein
MGPGQTFDDAIGEFAVEYADQKRNSRPQLGPILASCTAQTPTACTAGVSRGEGGQPTSAEVLIQ